jgi:hypothetical protein
MHPEYENHIAMSSHSQHVIMESHEAHIKAEDSATSFSEVLQTSKKRRTRKAKIKEKKPKYRPGEIRVSTALDGSTLFCCPECHMAYPDRYKNVLG